MYNFYICSLIFLSANFAWFPISATFIGSSFTLNRARPQTLLHHQQWKTLKSVMTMAAKNTRTLEFRREDAPQSKTGIHYRGSVPQETPPSLHQQKIAESYRIRLRNLEKHVKPTKFTSKRHDEKKMSAPDEQWTMAVVSLVHSYNRGNLPEGDFYSLLSDYMIFAFNAVIYHPSMGMELFQSCFLFEHAVNAATHMTFKSEALETQAGVLKILKLIESVLFFFDTNESIARITQLLQILYRYLIKIRRADTIVFLIMNTESLDLIDLKLDVMIDLLVNFELDGNYDSLEYAYGHLRKNGIYLTLASPRKHSSLVDFHEHVLLWVVGESNYLSHSSRRPLTKHLKFAENAQLWDASGTWKRTIPPLGPSFRSLVDDIDLL